jgi:PAS domain S-box-containing protein
VPIENLGGRPFFAICALIVLVILGLAVNVWRRLGTDDYRRIVGAAGLLLLARGLGVVALTFWPFVVEHLEWALEALALALFGWAYLAKGFSTDRRVRIYLVVSLTVILGFLLGGLGSRSLAGSSDPLLLIWPVILLVQSSLALGQWLRRRQRFSSWLLFAFVISFLGAGLGLLGLVQAAWALHLAALILFAIGTYGAILSDWGSYGQELQSVSERALRQTREMAFLLEVSQAIVASLDLPVVLERVSESVARAINADWAYILLPTDDDPRAFVLAARYGWWGRRWPQQDVLANEARLCLDDFPLLRDAIEGQRQVLANRPEEYQQLEPMHALQGRSQKGPTLIQPIFLKKRPLGAVLLGNDDEKAILNEADARLCQALVAQIATAIENARLYQSVDEQARRLAGLLRIREEESTQRQAILESIADGVVVAGQGGEVVLANVAAERILGLSREELMGQTIRRLYAELLRARGRGTGEQAVFDWGEGVVKGSMAPVKMPDGTLLGYVAVFRDVTREYQGEQAKSRFVATVSHELRTPMTSIKGYVDLLAAGVVGPVSPQQRDFLEIVRQNTTRMITLVNNLITVSEMEEGPIPIELHAVDMAGIIQDAVKAARPMADERQLVLNLSLPPDQALARGDAQRLRQIMDNLLDNALRYTPVGGEIRVWLTEAQVEDRDGVSRRHLVVNVRDTGVGIPADEHELIFEKFHRGENPLTVEAGGTGMGLAIVKELVNGHKGRIWVESQPGDGSTFTFVIPAAASG